MVCLLMVLLDHWLVLLCEIVVAEEEEGEVVQGQFQKGVAVVEVALGY